MEVENGMSEDFSKLALDAVRGLIFLDGHLPRLWDVKYFARSGLECKAFWLRLAKEGPMGGSNTCFSNGWHIWICCS